MGEVDEPTSVVVQRGYCGMDSPIRDACWHVPTMLYWRLEKWLDRGDHKFQRLFFELFRIKQRLILGRLWTQCVCVRADEGPESAWDFRVLEFGILMLVH